MNVKYWLFLALTALQTFAYADDWKEVVPRQRLHYTAPNGERRLLLPSCSGGPVCTFDAQGNLTQCQLADSKFSFFFQEGEDDGHDGDNPEHDTDEGRNLLIYLDQGGACWDTASCIASAATGVPVYAQAIDRATIRYAQNTGILADRADNPFQNWDKVFIPACTGDVLWGSRDYQYDNVGLPGITDEKITLHHRGFDNVLAALKWVRKRMGDDKPRKVVVAGSSAGGYGAVTDFAFVKEVWPNAKSYVIADAANGVMDSGFTQAVINNPDSPWGQQANLPTWIAGITNLPTSSNRYFIDFFGHLAHYYADKSANDPRYRPTQFAQYTTEWDVDQVFYYGSMQEAQDPAAMVELLFSVFLGESLNPSSLTYPTQNAAYCGWHGLMDQYTSDLAYGPNKVDNYRYYRASGYKHTILTETPPYLLPNGAPIFFNPQGIFYSENSGGVPFSQWVRGMLGEPGLPWQNQQCVGEQCKPPAYVICN